MIQGTQFIIEMSFKREMNRMFRFLKPSRFSLLGILESNPSTSKAGCGNIPIEESIFEKLGKRLTDLVNERILKKPPNSNIPPNQSQNVLEGNIQNTPQISASSIGPLKFGLSVIFSFFLFFFLWLGFAKLDGAVVAPGQIIFAKNKQTIQNLAGGVIEDFYIREGDNVRKGQVLLTFKDHDAKANFNIAADRLFFLKVQRERLAAQRDNLQTLELLPKLKDEAIGNSDKSEIIGSQDRLFMAELKSYDSRLKVFNQKIEQLKKESIGLVKQRKSAEQQLSYISQEIRTVRELLKDKSVSMTRLLNLQSQESQLLEKLTQYDNNISSNEGRRVETQAEIDAFYSSRAKDFEVELKELEVSITLEQEKLAAVQETLDKMTIRASEDGMITNLRYHKSGDVIGPGAPIMELLPNNDYLIVESRLMSKDINSLLASGIDLRNYNNLEISDLLMAKINFPTYSSRRYKKLQGVVFYVAADVAVDQRSGMTFYPLKVMISKKELEQASKANLNIFPGMAADAYVMTESRTPLSYLVSPITASFDRAFID